MTLRVLTLSDCDQAPLFKMLMRCQLFTDPIYHAERHIEFDPREVLSVELTRARLLLRGSFQVTRVRLQSGGVHLLKGDVVEEIQAARR